MNIVDWIPAASLAAALWLGRNLIATRLTASVAHEFDKKIEALRSKLREKEMEIEALRSGTLAGMHSRQLSLHSRKLKAVEQLWSAVCELGEAKANALFLAPIKFEKVAELIQTRPEVRSIFAAPKSGVECTKRAGAMAAKARPFVAPMAWALFSAYMAIAVKSAMKLEMLRLGIKEPEKLLREDLVLSLVKAAIPDASDLLNRAGDASYPYLMEQLESRILGELQKSLDGKDSDRESLERAAEIIGLAEKLSAQGERPAGLPSDVARSTDQID